MNVVGEVRSNAVAHNMNLESSGMVEGRISILSPYIVSLVSGSIRYWYQSGHQRDRSSLFWASLGCFARKEHVKVPDDGLLEGSAAVRVSSTWTKNHFGRIVPAGVYWTKNNLSVEAATVDSRMGGNGGEKSNDDD